MPRASAKVSRRKLSSLMVGSLIVDSWQPLVLVLCPDSCVLCPRSEVIQVLSLESYVLSPVYKVLSPKPSA